MLFRRALAEGFIYWNSPDALVGSQLGPLTPAQRQKTLHFVTINQQRAQKTMGVLLKRSGGPLHTAEGDCGSE